MTAKDYLNRHAEAEAKIKAMEREIDNLYQTAIGSAPIDEAGQPQHTGKSDKTGGLASLIAGMRSDIEFLWAQNQRIRHQIERTLYQVKGADAFQVLWKKYIERKHWEEIADEMDKAKRTVQRIHGEGLKEVEEILRRMEEAE